MVPSILVVSNTAVTARNIQAHELLYRLGPAAHVVVTLTNIPLALISCELFKAVNRPLALPDLSSGLAATAIEAASPLSQFTTVVLPSGRNYASALPPAQLHALAYLPGDLSNISYSVYGVFYGCGFTCEAYPVYKPAFVPRAIGILLAIDALNYPGAGFTTMLAPGAAAHLGAWTGLPTIIAEGSPCLWLLTAGLDTA